MTIRPIDMQTLIPKSQKISHINQNIMNKGENILQHGYNKDKEISKRKLSQVNTLNKKENPLIKNNYDEKKQNEHYKRNKKQKEENRKEKDTKDFTNSTIDIRI